jgi:hypothetical protein
MSGPLSRLDRAWTRLELALCLGVVAALLGSLLAWVALKGLSARTTDTFVAGVLFRAALLALAAGLAARRLGPRAGLAAVLLGAAAAWPLRDVGVDYFSNIFAWLQDGSLLTWFGGLRGLGTRLTLWLALLGASLATANGRHVTIDVATRALGEGLRRPLARVAGLVTAVVCAGAAWGFFDFIAIDAFHAARGGRPAEQVTAVAVGLGGHLARAATQLKVDVHVATRVLWAQPWDRCVTGAEWNAWLGDDAALESQREADPAAWRSPLLSLPAEGSRGLLVKDCDLIVPFGLLMLALRSLLWVLRGAPVEGAHGGSGGATLEPAPDEGGAA